MRHKIVSFYFRPMTNLEKAVRYQKMVFEYFGLEIEQVGFNNEISHQHSESMTYYLNNLKDWDSISIFDLDSVPTRSTAISEAIEKIGGGNTIYGNAQATNNAIPFAAPNFLNFTRDVWEKTVEIWKRDKTLERDVFRYEEEFNERGGKTMRDVAERFNIEHRKNGTKIILAYPISNDGDPEWEYNAPGDYPRFQWGNGTWFESGTFHGTEIRYEHKQKYFFDACERILRNE